MTLFDRRGDAHGLVDTLADSLSEVEAVALGDKRGDAAALVDNWLTRFQWWTPQH